MLERLRHYDSVQGIIGIYSGLGKPLKEGTSNVRHMLHLITQILNSKNNIIIVLCI